MPQIVLPAKGNNPPDPNRTFDDGPDDPTTSQAPLNWLHFLIFVPLVCGIFSLGAWSGNHSPQPPPTGPYSGSPSAVTTQPLPETTQPAPNITPTVAPAPNIAPEINAVPTAIPVPVNNDPLATTPPTVAPVTPPSTTPVADTKTPLDHKININSAGVYELNLLPGVGPVTARKIVDHRTTNGPFSSVEDLDKVSGIGEKKLEQIRPFATVN